MFTDPSLIKAWSNRDTSSAAHEKFEDVGIWGKNLKALTEYRQALAKSQYLTKKNVMDNMRSDALRPRPALVILGDVNSWKYAIADLLAVQDSSNYNAARSVVKAIFRGILQGFSRLFSVFFVMSDTGSPLAKVEVSTLLEMSPAYREKVLKEVIAWVNDRRGFLFINGIERLNTSETMPEHKAKEFARLRALILQPSRNFQLIVGAAETQTTIPAGPQQFYTIDMMKLDEISRRFFLLTALDTLILSRAESQSFTQRLNIFKSRDLKFEPNFSPGQCVVDIAKRMDDFSVGDVQRYVQNVLEAILKQKNKLISRQIFENVLNHTILEKNQKVSRQKA